MKQTNVINAVAHHNESVKTDVHVKARIFIGVKSCRTQNVRVRSAARHYLDPADVLTYAAALASAYKTAHIYFKSGLNEREESRAHSDGNVLTEHLGENALDHYLTGELVYDSNIRIMNDFTIWFMKKVGFEWAQIDEEYISGYINYFKSIGYLEV